MIMTIDPMNSGLNGSAHNGVNSAGFEIHNPARLWLITPCGTQQHKLGEQMARLGFTISLKDEDENAIRSLRAQKSEIDAVVLDWRQQSVKNAEFARSLASLCYELELPVLVLACADAAETIALAKEAGLANCLTAPCPLNELKTNLINLTSGMASPLESAPELDLPIADAFSLLQSCKFQFRTPEDVELLVPLLSRMFPDPDRSIAGIADLMMNAIEHGNLEIGHERKSEWIARGVYQNEFLKRLHTPPYSTRWGEVIINRRADGVLIIIMDQGCGFCWQNFVELEQPAVVEANGHGIARATKVSFDEVRFNHQGNQVTAFVAS